MFTKHSSGHAPAGRVVRSACAAIESLEARSMLSAGPYHPTRIVYHPAGQLVPMGSPAPMGFTPAQIRSAYGIGVIKFGAVAGDGKGQTIAIIDAYDSPTIDADLQAFDAQFGLPDPPNFTRVAQDGSTNYPATDPTGGWEGETALDVEWAHAIAPGANILLVEADSPYPTDLLAAVDYARNLPGVSVVSMSYGGDEFPSDPLDDFHYTTPNGHTGVSFFASAGDSGAFGSSGLKVPSSPATSPNVVAVGGTFLSISGSGGYVSETGWGNGNNSDVLGGGGGGISVYEAQPSYQQGFVSQSSSRRTIPDVAFVADPNSGVAVYDSFNNGTGSPWDQVGGTSLSAPCWAGLMSIVNQGRVLNGQNPMDGRQQLLPMIYSLSQNGYHDITAGNNGYAAGAGYDLVTGRGSPLANLLIPALAGVGTLPTVPPPVAGAPANDNFAQARSLAGSNLTISGSNLKATKEANEPNHGGDLGGHSVWYRWTAPVKASTTISLAGSGFDTTLGVYTGSSVGALTTVASNNNSGTSTASSVTFTPTAGKVYYIAVDGARDIFGNAASGMVIFSLKQAGVSTPSTMPPKNDNFGSAIGLTGSSLSVTWSNYGATRQSGEPQIATNPGGKSVWYAWTAPSAGATTITLAGSTFDTLLGIYRGSIVTGLTLVTSNNDENAALGITTSKVTFNAIKGVVYKIAIDGSNTSVLGAQYGTIKMKITAPAVVSAIVKSGALTTATMTAWQSVAALTDTKNN
jgi:subtilase family serine protease